MTRSLALALVLLLAACSNPAGRSAQGPSAPSQPPGAPSAPSTPTAPTTPTTAPGASSPSAPAAVTGNLTVTDDAGSAGPFKIGVVRKLTLAGNCTAASPGQHTLRFDVVSPNGTVYASMPQEVVVSDSGTASATAVIPLHGTTVESLKRSGTWNVTLTLDGGQPLVSADLDLTR